VSTTGWPQPGRVPTVRDVAAAAHVSVATVSRVLNGDGRVQPERRERVEAAIRQLGYRRDSVARNLRRGSTKVWGLLISDIENPFFTSLVRGVQDTAELAGYSVVLLNSDEDLEKEARSLRVLAEERVAGVILSPVSEHDSDLSGLPASTPTVLLDRQITGLEIDTVSVAHARGGYEGTAHLLAAGYERVACISGPRHATTGASRIEGYEQALRDAGHALDPELVCATDFKRGGGHEAARRLLDLQEPPDAIIAMNNLMTEATLWALQERGLVVPQDVGLVGFDDLSWSTLVRPRLTVVAQPVRQLGIIAAELLAQRCRGDRSGFPATVRLLPQITVRESSVPAARS
jgi:LacI family transcriptional regulator